LSKWVCNIVWAASLVAALAPRAHAYTLALPGRHGCHEEMTATALRTARAMYPTSAPAITPSRNDEALINDIAWLIDPDMRDFGGVSLLLGARDNDLKGHALTDSFETVQINADPTLQNEHCLRTPSEDEPNGTAAAIADCHQFVLDKVGAALDAMDAQGVVDATMMVHLPVDLALRGSVTDSILPQFYVYMGEALHTIEDGFSHTFRTSDGMMITSALNWTEDVSGELVESRDGPPHSFELDDCNATDALRVQKHQLATQAATEVMTAIVNPTLTRDQKLAAVDAVFAKYFTIAPGCNEANEYCDPIENKLRDTYVVCDFSGFRGGHPLPLALLLLVLLAMHFLRRRSTRVLLLCLALAGGSSRALAQSESGAIAAPEPTPAEVAKIQEAKRLGPRFGVYVAFGGSIDRPAIAATLGVRLRLSRRWTIGLDGEMNPWITTAGDVRLGSANIAARVILKYPLNWSRVGLHTSASLGTAIQLLDLYGAERGSVGIFGGGVPLGIDVAIMRGFRFVFDPIGIYVPAPHLPGAPLWYLQYRITVGLAWGG
jgi:hypothetical protein